MTAIMAAPALDFVVYYVADLEASSEFFEGTLGFARRPEGDSPVFRQFVDGAGNGFGLSRAGEGTPAAGEVRLYYKTADVAALRGRWMAHGASASPVVARPFGKISEVVTPDGTVLTGLEEVKVLPQKRV